MAISLDSIAFLLVLCVCLIFADIVLGLLRESKGKETIVEVVQEIDSELEIVKAGMDVMYIALNEGFKYVKGFAQTIEARITRGAKGEARDAVEGVAKGAIEKAIGKIDIGDIIGNFLGSYFPNDKE